MEQNFTDEQLDQQLGTSSKQFTKFKTISIDNGIDTMGTGATGNFVEKQYNTETQQTTRIEFANGVTGLPGIILAAKAQVADKAKYPSWRTGEFDPSNVSEQIEVFPLQGGKFIKEANGDVKKFYTTYQELKAAKSTPNPDGGSTSNFNYFIVLYVGVDGEVIKLKFKGSSRGNWFDYSKFIGQLGAKVYNVLTIFSSYKDVSTGKYAIKFDVDKDKNGKLTEVDPADVREMRVAVAESLKPFAGKSLGTPKKYGQISAAPAANTATEARPAAANDGPFGTTKTADDEEINIADMEEEVPFNGTI